MQQRDKSGRFAGKANKKAGAGSGKARLGKKEGFTRVKVIKDLNEIPEEVRDTIRELFGKGGAPCMEPESETKRKTADEHYEDLNRRVPTLKEIMNQIVGNMEQLQGLQQRLDHKLEAVMGAKPPVNLRESTLTGIKSLDTAITVNDGICVIAERLAATIRALKLD